MVRTKENLEGRRSRAGQAVVPTIYREMLADTVSSPTQLNKDGNATKKRRIAGRMVTQTQEKAKIASPDQDLSDGNSATPEEPAINIRAARKQTAYQDSEDSAESDMNWEEIDIANNLEHANASEDEFATVGELNIILGGDEQANQQKKLLKRKPITSAERKLRLEIHKMHLLTLLVHVHSRNNWCNDEHVHAALRKLLSSRTTSYLNLDERNSQFQRSRSFVDGLSQASEEFRKKFKIIARGMSRPYWAESPEALANVDLPKDLELPIRKSDFCLAANKLEGSRDVGAQIFCALLRSNGVDARLVCSLQPLPFNPITKGTTPQKPSSIMIIANPDSRTTSSNDESEVETKKETSSIVPRSIGYIGGRSRFGSKSMPNFGQPVQSSVIDRSNINALNSGHKSKRIKESPFPVYWVEAFNEAVQKWTPVDPLTTKTVSKPSKFEPPASDSQNNLSYVLAFEDDGSTRDVTRRYAKAYNAKTRKARVEATKGGERWWSKVLKIYNRLYELPRDQVEDAELAAREAAEEMPRNVMDFKDHPYYALERHLKRSEVIHPKREVGKVGAGRGGGGGSQALEPIFRRRDVHMVKSADSWYRQGREIKIGEQPLKHVPARRGKDSRLDDGEDPQSGEEGRAGTALYAAFQTVTYSAPPVVHGRVPKNIYGNLDIYVPSMVPPGGTHIPHPETARAAQILGIDYADAVTGFAFKGRHGTAVVTGAVVASVCCEAVEDVIRGLEDEATQQEEVRRSLEALKMWRRFLKGLRIRARIGGYEIEGERAVDDERIKNEEEEEEDEEKEDQEEDEEEEEGEEDEARGFLPDAEGRVGAEPTAGGFFGKQSKEYEEAEGGGFLLDAEHSDGDGGGGFMVSEGEDGGEVANYANEHGMKRAELHGSRFYNHYEGVSRDYPDEPQDTGVQEGLSDDGILNIVSNDMRRNFYGGGSEHNGEDEEPEDAVGWQKSEPQIQLRARPERKEQCEEFKVDDMIGDSLDTEGGFNVGEESELSSPKTKSNAVQLETPLPTSHQDLPDDELAEAFMLQKMHENDNVQPINPANPNTLQSIKSLSPISPAPENQSSATMKPRNAEAEATQPIQAFDMIESINETSKNTIYKKKHQDADDKNEDTKINNEDGAIQESNPTGETSEEDAGSLLSHDPSDEDADPEWLA